MKRILFMVISCVVGLSIFAQSFTVTGKVTDQHNESIIGATIMVKGTTTGTTTDFDGNFSIHIPSKSSMLVISYVGMQTKEVAIGNNTTGLIIQLADDSKVLEEVVVVGFGTQKKINATGAVKTIDNKMLESRPISNAVQGLQGVVAGLNITNDNGGALGQPMNINIRGLGTIGEGSVSSPLVLIDGIEGDLSTINPNDIANISVLKDAAAASIYGSRAPFGVILVTTKEGTEQDTRYTYTGNVRLSAPIAIPKAVDSYTYALMVNDAYGNAGGNPPFGSSQLNKIQRYQRGELLYGIEQAEGINDWAWNQRSFGNTNWYEEHLKSYTYSQEHNLSVRGGTKKINYFLSGNYLNQNGLFTHADEQFTRLSINGKMNISLSDKLNFNWSTRIVDTKNDKPTALNALFYHNLGRRSPLMPVYMPNGEYNKESLIPSLLNGGRYLVNNQQFYNQGQLVFEPIKKWKFYFDLGSRIEKPNESRQFKKLSYTLPDGTSNYFPVLEGVADKSTVTESGTIIRQPAAGTNYYERALGNINYINTNARTDYELQFDKHYFKVLLGVQSEYYFTEIIRVASDNITLDEKPFLPAGSGTNPRLSEKKGDWSNLGLFGRVNYAFDDKYMVEMNMRGDAASRFPTKQRWGAFPSISAGWNMGQEKFWSSMYEKGFEMIKIRASYGVLGNQNTSSFYPYFQYMNSEMGGLVINDTETIILPGPRPFATSLTWEKIENTGMGIDLGFLSNRFSASLDWYQRITRDMVGPAKPLPAVYGAAAPRTNNAELKTKGWEIELNWRDRIGKDLNYFITATLSDYQSIVTKYDSPDGALNGYFPGKKLGDIWGYQVEGIAKSDQEMNDWLQHTSQSALGKNWGGGDLMYKDIDDSGSVNAGGNSIFDSGDLTVIGNGTPRYAYSMSMGMSRKDFDFSLFFQGIGKRDVFFNNSATFFGFAGEWQRSLFMEHLDYFRYAGDPLGANLDPYYGRLRTDNNNIQISDRFLQNASYLRLKNLQVGYSLPKTASLSKYIYKARLYLSGENLFTFTNLRIYDPEAIGSSISEYGPGKTYPMYRVFSIGLEVTL
ncbi:MAG: TonB-dependent receptor [Pigmentiphaga sp.]|nr:TonB-dependent receptor [Pigmentiphaga sp.]